MENKKGATTDPLQQMLMDRLEHDEKVQQTDRLIDRVSKPTMAIVAVVLIVCASYSYIHIDAIFTFFASR
jgi:hypothetical protein